MRQADWLVTPYFFDRPEPVLVAAAGDGVAVTINDGPEPRDRSAAALAPLHGQIRRFVAESAGRGGLPVSVAGDCLASLPVMAGLQWAGLVPQLVWLDAHGDFNTPETSPSGFLGGMPLAMMVGRGPRDWARAAAVHPLAEHDVWLIGARDLDPLEAAALGSSAVRRGTIDTLCALRLGRPVHLHVDNDVLDATEVPANNYPVANGPMLEQVIAACTEFAAVNRVAAISFSGWTGALDPDGGTAQTCRRLLDRVVAACAAAG